MVASVFLVANQLSGVVPDVGEPKKEFGMSVVVSSSAASACCALYILVWFARIAAARVVLVAPVLGSVEEPNEEEEIPVIELTLASAKVVAKSASNGCCIKDT